MEITTKEIDASPALVIRAEVGTFKMAKIMGPAYQKIMNHYEAVNIECGKDDIPYCIYRDINWETVNQKGFISMFKLMFFHTWKLEMGIPARSACPSSDDMIATELPAGQYLRTIHKGPYMKVSQAYTRLLDYAKENNLDFDNYSIERYLNDPCEVSASEIETEVLVPLK